MSVDPGIELGLTVFVTLRRYCQTNSAQALKQTNRFTQLGLGLGLEEVFVFDSKSEKRDRAVEAVESVPEARLGLGLGLGVGVTGS